MQRLILLVVMALAGCAGAGEFVPPAPLPPPSGASASTLVPAPARSPLLPAAPKTSPLPFGDFGDFSANDDIFGGFGAEEPELLSVSLAADGDKLILTLNHQNGGYTYWVNPGGVGVPTRVEWDLPDGFSVSEPEWPAPVLYNNGAANFYIYQGNVSLVYTLTPPAGFAGFAAGEKITVRGNVHTQVCTSRTCVPTVLPVSVDVTGEATGAAAQAIAALPRPGASEAAGWRFEAADAGGGLVIGMHPLDGNGGAAASLSAPAPPELKDVYFFDQRGEPFVDSQLPQHLEQADGAWRLHLPRLPEPARTGENLVGVLRMGRADAGEPVAFRLDLPVDGEGAGLPSGLQPAVERREWMLLLFAFFGGLLLNIMPCVFPVIGLKIMGFAKQAHKERRAVFLHGLAYACGVLLCFWALALIVITMGRGWGAQLQSEWFLFALCHIFLIMSMNMAGVFEVGASVAGAGQQEVSAQAGLKRSFFTGLLATLTSTPCSAPFLGTALAYALSLPPLMSLGVFTLMALGFAFPYLALSLFPNWLKRLPKPGPWMDTFRQAMCFPLFGTTAYLFWTMEAMMEEWRFLLLLFGLVFTAMACWLYGKYQHSRLRRPVLARWSAGLAVLALAGGVWLGLPKGEDELVWQDWSPEAVSRLRAEGVPVYIDFTARWCATCQLNKRVYADEGLRELLRGKNVALLKADWTLYDERITSTLRSEFNKAAVPVTAVYAPGSARAEILPDILTVESVAEVLRELP